MFVPKSSQSYKVYEQKNAIHKDCALGSYYITKEKYDSLIGFAVQPYDIIVSCAGTIGETYVLPAGMQEGIINQALMLIRLFSKEIERFYLLYFDFILKDEAYRNSKGTAIKNIPPFDVLKNFFIPIPPIGEQKRILDEVDRLMSFVSTIETGTKNLHTAIKQAKFKILELAIHGKLVSQDQNDEPASELLKRINPKAEIITDNGHYQKLPVGWTICKLKDICSKLVDGDHNPPKGTKETTEYLMLSAQNIVNDNIVYTNGVRYLNHDAFETSDKRTKVMQGDLLITIVGTLGRSCVFSDNKKITLQRSVACLTPLIYNHFLKYYMDSSSIQKYMTTNAKGTAQKGFYLNQLEQLPIMIPPLTEQQRIVARIEKIFARLDVIESAL